MTRYYKKIAAPAAGKSYGAVRYMIERIKKGEKFVLCSISVELCKALADDILSVDENINLKLLLSENTKYGVKVRDRYTDHLSSEDYDVLIITHKTLINAKGSCGEGWSMIVDELPNIMEINSVLANLEDDSVSRWLTPSIPTGNSTKLQPMELRMGWEDGLHKYLEGVNSGKEESLINSVATKGLEELLTGETIILREQFTDGKVEKVRYYFCSISDPSRIWKGFNDVIFLCAEFDRQLTGVLFNKRFNLEVREENNISLRRESYVSPERITIYPLIKAPQPFTKYLSNQYYDKDTGRRHLVKIEDSYVEVFQHLISVAEDIVGKEGYIYTVNNIRKEQILKGDHRFLQERDKVKCLQYNPHGLNSFMDYNIALGLFHCNPTPIQDQVFRYLEEQDGIVDRGYLKGYEMSAYLDPIFQLVTRTAIRKFEDIEDIICIVPDHRAATYLSQGWFKGAIVDYKYAVDLDDKRKGNSRPPKFQKTFNMNSKEASAFRRWVNKQGWNIKNMNVNNSEQYNKVKEWLDDKRK